MTSLREVGERARYGSGRATSSKPVWSKVLGQKWIWTKRGKQKKDGITYEENADCDDNDDFEVCPFDHEMPVLFSGGWRKSIRMATARRMAAGNMAVFLKTARGNSIVLTPAGHSRGYLFFAIVPRK